MIAAGTAGATAGNLLGSLVARMIGLRSFKRFIDRRGRWLTMDWYDVQRVERMFGRFGWGVVLVGRLLPTIRSVVSIPAGLVRMRFARFLVWSTLGTAAWSSLLAFAGWVLGMQFDRIETVLGPLSSAIIALIVIFYLWRQLTWSRRHRGRG